MAHNRGRAASRSATSNAPSTLNEVRPAAADVNRETRGNQPTSLIGFSPLSDGGSVKRGAGKENDGREKGDEEHLDDDDDDGNAGGDDNDNADSPDTPPFSLGSSESESESGSESGSLSDSESYRGNDPESEPKAASGPRPKQHQLGIQKRPAAFLHPSNSSSSFPMANSFAPPFYNRPPTPLPPSPSLTSLLRPAFSNTISRPTTSDSSENDTPNDTEAAVAKSARTATTVPRASPKVPTYEYYGFVLYLLSSLVFLMYLLWSYLPSPFLHQLGIHYYPDRWWALAIPSYLVMTIVYIYIALASYNVGYLTLPMNSIENIVDDAADVAVVDEEGKIKRKGRRRKSLSRCSPSKNQNPTFILHDVEKPDWKTPWSNGTDAVMDVPLGGVCQVLYGS